MAELELSELFHLVINLNLRVSQKPGMVVHAHYSRTQKVEVGEHPDLHSTNLPQTTTTTTKTTTTTTTWT